MDDDRIVRLLEEIRDLQSRHVANHEEALRNQRESIDSQQKAIRYQRKVTRRLLITLVPVAALLVITVVWLLLWLRSLG